MHKPRISGVQDSQAAKLPFRRGRGCGAPQVVISLPSKVPRMGDSPFLFIYEW
jgi:hypothetical protein